MVEATSIELRKIAYRQSAKDGLVITFACHPDDMPATLAAAPIGSRFMAALVEIGDDEQPVERAKQDRRVQTAGIMCLDELFQRFLAWEFPLETETHAMMDEADRAAQILREHLNIKSRRELASNANAAAKFDALVAKFEMWKRGQ